MFTITGKIKKVMETQQISDSFKKRELVLTDDSGPYSQDILFQLTQDRTELADNLSAGDDVTLHFNLRGREWTNKEGKVMYFNSLDVWRVEQAQAGGQPPLPTDEPPFPTSSDSGADTDDDLPF